MRTCHFATGLAIASLTVLSACEPDQATIFDGADDVWNGAWTLAGTTLSRSFGTDFGGEQPLTETSTLALAR